MMVDGVNPDDLERMSGRKSGEHEGLRSRGDVFGKMMLQFVDDLPGVVEPGASIAWFWVLRTSEPHQPQ
jgi:hypothetical protein